MDPWKPKSNCQLSILQVDHEESEQSYLYVVFLAGKIQSVPERSSICFELARLVINLKPSDTSSRCPGSSPIIMNGANDASMGDMAWARIRLKIAGQGVT